MVRLKKAQSAQLTQKQIDLGAKFLAASNTGLVGFSYDIPTNEGEIERLYDNISYEYENELGDGLDEEYGKWKEDLENGKDLELLNKYIPWLLEDK